jgi:transitional endoplasmic reticulum ATPase
LPDVLDGALTRPGRLDSLIYIPVPDQAARYGIMKAALRKSSVHPNVDLNFLSGKDTENFTGADLTELCQRACRNAVRDSIENDRNWIRAERERLGDPEAEIDKEAMPDAVPCLTRDHFQEAFNNARRSVEPASLEKYNNYRKMNDP